MSSNQCPVCNKEAMDAMTKLMRRPHVCQHSGTELRMNLIFTIIVSLAYFGLAVRSLIVTGFNGEGMLHVLLMNVVYVVICLFIPLESKQPQTGS